MSKSILTKCRAAVGATLALGTICWCLAAEPGDPPRRSASLEQLKPNWQLGDKWIVETITQPLQTRGSMDLRVAARPIQWQFAVQRFEKAISDDCYRVEIRCMLDGPPQPATVLWVDRKSHALRKIQTQIPVPGGFRTVTENYEFADGQPSPVLGPLTALPVDLPLLVGGEAKGSRKFIYEANTNPSGQKALGDVGFAYAVEQEVAPAAPNEAKGLLGDAFAKALVERPAVEVKLKGPGREVRQLWQPGLPWPAYSESGATVSRLVKVIPAGSGSDR
jgi:hypothetical protein